MFPTRLKSKLSQKLSYPVSAKDISEALAEVPQADLILIDFFWHKRIGDKGKPHHPDFWWHVRRANRGKPYPVFRAVYTGTELGEPSSWYVQVEPVPRHLRPLVRTLLKQEAFPAICEWFRSRAKLDSRYGAQTVTAVFDQEANAIRIERNQAGGEAL